MLAKNTPSFKKTSLEISTPISNLPFMFSVGLSCESYSSTSASDRKDSLCTKSPKHKSSFKQELQKLGISANLIPEKNPLKPNSIRINSPDLFKQTGLPFQRRARSSSPPKENLKVFCNKNNLFPPRSPVIVSHKIKFKEDFTGLCKDSLNSKFEEDDDLRLLKEQYRKLLEGVPKEFDENDSESIENEGEIEKIETQFGFISQTRYFK